MFENLALRQDIRHAAKAHAKRREIVQHCRCGGRKDADGAKRDQ